MTPRVHHRRYLPISRSSDAPTTPDWPRLVLAWAASVVTGVVIYQVVIKVGLPALSTHLTDQQIDWLREAFRVHPVRVLSGVLLTAAVLALPVLAVFRIGYGPLLRRR